MSKEDEPDYLAMAAEADLAALKASGTVAKRFLAEMAEEYRKRATEKLGRQTRTNDD